MKHKLLSFILLLSALVAGTGSVWAETYDFTFSTTTGSYNSSAKTNTWVSTYCTILQAKGTGSTDPNKSYLANPRWYSGNYITFTPAENYKITSIVITATGTSNTGQDMTVQTGDGSVAKTSSTVSTWTGNATNSSPLTLKMGSQCRVSKVNITYELTSSISNPVITPANGAKISGTQSVEISQAEGKDVYYTTDGTTPTETSTHYTEPFNVSASLVTGKVEVKAIAIDGSDKSEIVSAIYTDPSIQPLNVAFTFNNALFGTSYSGPVNKATIEAAGGNVTGTVNNVQVEYALGTGSNFYLKDSEIRVYEGNTLTFTAPTGYNITKIVFTGGTLQYNGSALSNRTWEGEENSVVFTATSSTTVYTATVTLDRALPLVATLGDLNVTALEKDATGTFTTTVTPATGLSDSDYTLGWAATPAGLTVAANGAYTAVSRGTYTVTATATSTNPSYKDASKKYTVTVSAPVEVTAPNVEMTYGDAAKAIGAEVSDGYAGTLTYESANTSVATVDASGEVTAVAVGSTTITITAPADAENLYTAGSPVAISVTVNAPAGLTEFPVGDAVQLYKRIETKGTGLPAGWTTDAGNLWHYDVNYGAVAGGKQTGNGVQDTNYDMVTEDFDLSGYCEPFVYFSHVGNKISSNKATVCKLFVQEGSETPVELTIPNWFGGTNWTFVNSGNIDLSDYAGKTVHFIFRYTPSGTNANGTWEVKDFTIKAYNIPSANVTLNKYGYATYCSVNPIDFTNTTGYTAWRVSEITSEGVITFTKITDMIKGGQGVVLHNKDADGMNTSDVTVTFADGTTEFTPSENKLVGTLAPTNVEAGTAYGLSGNRFVVNKVSGNISAGKAYIEASSIPAGVKDFTLVFEDETTGITETRTATREEVEAIFNLAGQRMSRMHKGVNIVNGKKILVK